jgi:hypothetical protein
MTKAGTAFRRFGMVKKQEKNRPNIEIIHQRYAKISRLSPKSIVNNIRYVTHPHYITLTIRVNREIGRFEQDAANAKNIQRHTRTRAAQLV